MQVSEKRWIDTNEDWRDALLSSQSSHSFCFRIIGSFLVNNYHEISWPWSNFRLGAKEPLATDIGGQWQAVHRLFRFATRHRHSPHKTLLDSPLKRRRRAAPRQIAGFAFCRPLITFRSHRKPVAVLHHRRCCISGGGARQPPVAHRAGGSFAPSLKYDK